MIELSEPDYGKRWMAFGGSPKLLFTENETNTKRLFNYDNGSPYTKDGINDFVVNDKIDAVNPAQHGTKASAHYKLNIAGGGSTTVKIRLTNTVAGLGVIGSEFDEVFANRQREADEFYSTVIPPHLSQDAQNVMRQSLAGLLWSKQFYHYVVSEWLEGDPAGPPRPEERKSGRNHEWTHLYNADVISVPDKWEYPGMPCGTWHFTAYPLR